MSMKPRHQVSRAAIELIKRFEGYRRKAAQLPDGRWTIGYGHTLTARQGAEVTEEDAEALLLYDLIAVSFSVNEWIFTPLCQNQFDALCSFAFNVGLDDFRRSSVLKRINEGALLQAACGMELWRKADFEGERLVVDALVRRRAHEKALFLTPDKNAWAPAPTPTLKPRYDIESETIVPADKPTPLVAALDGDQVLVHRETPSEADVPTGEQPPSPILAAAAVVTARLQTLFQESADPAAVNFTTSDASADVSSLIPSPQGEPAPVAQNPRAVLTPRMESETELELGAADRADQHAAHPGFSPIYGGPPPVFRPATLDRREIAAEPVELPAGVNFAGAAAANDPVTAADPDPTPVAPVEKTEPPPPIPAAAPVEAALPPPKTDVVTIVVLAILGLAFFAGGVFWALNAGPGPQTSLVNPLVVGWLAGASGVGFFSIAVYMALEALGRAARRSRRRTR